MVGRVSEVLNGGARDIDAEQATESAVVQVVTHGEEEARRRG